MNNIKLQRKNIAIMLILSAITYGLYYPIWFFKQKGGLNSLNAKEKLDILYPVIMLIGSIGYIGFEIALFLYENTKALITANIIINLTTLIVIIKQEFLVRRILLEHINTHKENIKISKIATFILGIYYLQYKINKTLEIETK